MIDIEITKKDVAREFEGVWIPAKVWLADNLSAEEKVLLGEIYSCEVFSEKHFAKFLNKSEDQMSRMIHDLKQKRYI